MASLGHLNNISTKRLIENPVSLHLPLWNVMNNSSVGISVLTNSKHNSACFLGAELSQRTCGQQFPVYDLPWKIGKPFPTRPNSCFRLVTCRPYLRLFPYSRCIFLSLCEKKEVSHSSLSTATSMTSWHPTFTYKYIYHAGSKKCYSSSLWDKISIL